MYSCVLLKNPEILMSHLINNGYLKDIILNDEWEIICHHMTINMGGIEKGPGDLNDKNVQLTVTDIAKDDKVCAVKCEGYPTLNKIPHITIAVNRSRGGKPVQSNQLSNWEPIVNIVVEGEVVEI